MVDALSWKVHHIYEIPFSNVESKLLSQIKEAAMKDPKYDFLWQKSKKTVNSGKLNDYGINGD